MFRGLSPRRKGSPTEDAQRLAILKAELEDLDHMLPHVESPIRAPSPPRTRTPVQSSVRKPTSSVVEGYENALMEHATARRQLQFLNREVGAVLSSSFSLPDPMPPPPMQQQQQLSFINPESVRKRVETRIGSQSPHAPQTPRSRGTGVKVPTTRLTSTDTPVDALLMDEVKQREQVIEQLERKIAALNRKATSDQDNVKQAVMLLRHSLSTTTTNGGSVTEHIMAAQNALDLLDEVKGEAVNSGFDDRLRQRIEEHEQAKERLQEARTAFEGAPPGEREARVLEMLEKHELAAVASEGVKKEHTKKVMLLTRQLCDGQAEQARLDEVIKQKGEQLKAAHEALAHTTSQLAAVADTTKEMSRVQEEKQHLNKELCATRDHLRDLEGKAARLEADGHASKDAADQLAASEHRMHELRERHEAVAAELKAARGALEEQEAHLMQAQQELESKTDMLARSTERSKELEREVLELAGERDEMKRRALEERGNLDNASGRLCSVEKELGESEGRVIKLTEQLQTSVAEVNHLSRSLKETAAQLDATNVELAALNTASEGLRAENATLRENSKVEQADRIHSQREVIGLTAKLADITRQREELEQKFREKESMEALHQEDLFRKDTQAELMAKQLREKESDLERKERELVARETELRHQVNSLAGREERLHSMEKELITKRQELGHSVVSSTITNSKIVELTQMLENKEAELADIKATNAGLSDSLRSLEVDHEQDIEKRIQLEQLIEVVRAQLGENTAQFSALTEDLQSTRQRLDVELAQRGALEEQVRHLTEANAAFAVQQKGLEAEATRLAAANEGLEVSLKSKDEVLCQQRVEYDRGVTELRHKLAENTAVTDHARQQEILIEKSRSEAQAVTDMLKTVQKELVMTQARLEDAAKHATTLWSAIARLGRKFEEYEKNHQLRATRPVHEKFEDACSFLRYIRGWWSMYKEKDPSLDDSAASIITATTTRMLSPGRLLRQSPDALSVSAVAAEGFRYSSEHTP